MATVPSQAPEGQPDDQPVPSLVDLVFYAPIGLVLNAATEYRKKASVARFIGKMVVDQQKRRRRGPVVVQPASPEVFETQPMPRPVDSPAAHDLPIDGYETLATRSILALLDGLSPADLDQVELFERANRQRATILHRLSQLKNPA